MSKKVKFVGTCLCSYSTELELPDDVDANDISEVLWYINNNLNDAPALGDYEYIGGDMPIVEDDIKGIEEE